MDTLETVYSQVEGLKVTLESLVFTILGPWAVWCTYMLFRLEKTIDIVKVSLENSDERFEEMTGVIKEQKIEMNVRFREMNEQVHRELKDFRDNINGSILNEMRAIRKAVIRNNGENE